MLTVDVVEINFIIIIISFAVNVFPDVRAEPRLSLATWF